METPNPDEADIFNHARQIIDPEARRLYLQQACANDEAVRARIEALLRAHERPGHPLDSPLVVDTGRTGAYVLSAEVGASIPGRYRLLEKIGEGGMGTVWVAEQIDPVKRKVALKLIKPGMDSQSVLARFEAERQALALMDHPNIAKVFDGGITETGRPFFVMEYVKGVPITEYCDATRLDIAGRLGLLVHVCHALQHAHQKGIIHRDLKPSNILVAPYDGTPVPKVIDFGLAKAVQEPLTERTLHTGHETILGTPLYMSPEQAQLNNLDVDTRTDIYSLGVLLYELLTGTTPLEKRRFKEAAWDEVRRILREEEPPRPSARLSTTEALPSVAACRQSEPARLTKLVRGELDWIVMKALAKDRSRRYETANSLARDLERYLNDEPVEARPPSASYQLRKFVQRHKGPVIAAIAVLLALLAGIVGTAWGLVRADRARNDAIAAQSAEAERAEGERLARQQAQAAEKQALEEKQRAVQEKQVADAVRDFLQKKLLGQADTRAQADAAVGHGEPATVNRNVTVRELLDRAAMELAPERIEASFRGQPLLQAELLRTVGRTYRALGELDPAVALLQRSATLCQASSAPDSTQTLTTLDDLGEAYQDVGKLQEAIQAFEQVRALREKKLGADHADTLFTLDHLAVAYQRAGRLQEAIQLYEQVRDARVKRVGPDHPDILPTLNNLAETYRAAGQLPQAIELFERVRDIELIKLGPTHPETLVTLDNLALAYEMSGQVEKALPLLEQVRVASEKTFGPDNQETLAALANLARAYRAANRLPEAVQLFEQVRAGQAKKLPPDHPQALITLNNLAVCYYDVGKLPEAIRLLEQVGDLQTKKLGANHQDTLTTYHNLAALYGKAKQTDKSLRLYEDVLKRREAQLGRNHRDTLGTVGNLGVAYRDAGQLDKAIPLLEEAYRKSDAQAAQKVGDDLQLAYSKAGKTLEATKLIDERLAGARQRFPAGSPQLAGALSFAGKSWLDLKRYPEAESILRESLTLREKLLEEKQVLPWQVANVKSLLGGALLGQKKYGEAAPLLQLGFEGLKRDEKEIPPQSRGLLADAVTRLIDLARATGKKDDAAKWEGELKHLRDADRSPPR